MTCARGDPARDCLKYRRCAPSFQGFSAAFSSQRAVNRANALARPMAHGGPLVRRLQQSGRYRAIVLHSAVPERGV